MAAAFWEGCRDWVFRVCGLGLWARVCVPMFCAHHLARQALGFWFDRVSFVVADLQGSITGIETRTACLYRLLHSFFLLNMARIFHKAQAVLQINPKPETPKN